MKRMTIKEASETTSLSEYALRTGCKQGRYPHIRIGGVRGKILIDIDLLERYLLQEAVDNVKEQEEIHYGGLRRVEE